MDCGERVRDGFDSRFFGWGKVRTNERKRVVVFTCCYDIWGIKSDFTVLVGSAALLVQWFGV